ncbi:MAG: DEAD/DEAH box helicase family protein [Chlorobium sp.]|nr:DEAD/DEAH box helicase family protein [Chlorobium sp.]
MPPVKKTTKLNLSEHTLDVNEKKFDIELFDFQEIEEFVSALTQSRSFQFEAIKKTMIYLWGGNYTDVTQLATENFKKKVSIQKRFLTEENFLRHLPLPGKRSGVIHLATGTGKSFLIFAIAYLSIVMKLTKRVLVLGPSSTVIEAGLRQKFKMLMQDPKLTNKLPPKYRNVPVVLLDETKPAEDYCIIIENINAIYNKDRNAIGDTLFSQTDDVLVLSDEVHHAYTHLTFTDTGLALEANEGTGDGRNERLWMKFLREEPKITRHIGFTGTPYNQDEYFTDIIYNYSIPDARRDQRIKEINPILHTTSDDNLTPDQVFEIIYKTHLDNKSKYSYPKKGKACVKPITLFIAPQQNVAIKQSEEFIRFLGAQFKQVKGSDQPDSYYENLAREKVICVISKLAESEYKKKLDEIENLKEPTEFIFAVEKLSEGWDVDNVFQIVPMQERVFKSKRLISQVLGRGLRMPRKVPFAQMMNMAPYPVVTVTNHEKFADHIRELVDYVTQCEVYFSSSTLKSGSGLRRALHNFTLFNIAYTPVSTRVDKPQTDDKPQRERLHLKPQTNNLGVTISYLVTGDKKFELRRNFVTVDEVVYAQAKRFTTRDFESKLFRFTDTVIIEDRLPDAKDIRHFIRSAMKTLLLEGDRLSEENAQIIDLYFGQYMTGGRKKNKRGSIPGNLTPVRTEGMDRSSIRVSEVDKDTTVFLSEDYESELGEDNLFALEHLKNIRGNFDARHPMLFDVLDDFIKKNKDYIRALYGYKPPYAVNTSIFKSPQNLVRVSSNPEKQFVYGLIEHTRYLQSWLKSRDMGFYSIDYEYFRKGKDRVRASFNPDFFIKIDLDKYIRSLKGEGADIQQLRVLQDKGFHTIIKVVEIKSDDDTDETTPAKERYATEHFALLNQKLQDGNIPADFILDNETPEKQLYTFDLLVPSQYDSWFTNLKEGRIAL